MFPQAALRLKQEVGQLNRTCDDRGVMAMLDMRLHTKGYDRQMLGAVPLAKGNDTATWWRMLFHLNRHGQREYLRRLFSCEPDAFNHRSLNTFKAEPFVRTIFCYFVR